MRIKAGATWIAAGILLLACAVASADPLHRVAGTQTWRHEFSGWLFAEQVDGLERLGAAYQLEGGDDAGALYSSSTAEGIQLRLEVHTGVALAAPPGALPFALDAATGVRGLRAVAGEGAALTAQYLFTRDEWTVRIIATAPSPDDLPRVDQAVRALPWHTLGAAERLH